MIRLAVRVKREQAELVLAELLELAPDGVEEVEVDPDIIEYAVYGAPGELPSLPALNAIAGGALVELSTSELADDWQERWKRFHRPVLIDAPVPPSRPHGRPVSRAVPGLHVRPPWEAPYAMQGSVREIVIDPGQAFGTGAHHSTRLCLELLLALAVHSAPSGPLLDVGTGSGVLAIAAAGLGFHPVLGLDNELESVHAAHENAAVNEVEIDVRQFDLRSEPMPWLSEDGQAGPVVMSANLLRPLLLELASTMTGPPEHLIAGGLLLAEVEEVAGAFGGRLQLRERERRSSGEWAALWLSRD